MRLCDPTLMPRSSATHVASAEERATVDRDRRSCDEARRRRGEQQREALQLLGVRHPPERDRRRPHALGLLVRVERRAAADARALERARADRVHEHAVRRQLERGLAHQVQHRRLARDVTVADDRLGPEAGDRRRDHDPAGALALHHRGGPAQREEHAVQVHAEHALPHVALDRVDALAALDGEAGDGGDAGVREDDVDPAVCRDGVVEERLDLRLVRHVGDERADGAAGERVGRGREQGGVDVGERDAGAAVGQHLREREAEAARRAGDDDAAVAHLEEAGEHLGRAIRRRHAAILRQRPQNTRVRRRPSDGGDGGLLPWIAAERAFRGLVLVAIGIVLISHAQSDWGRVIGDVVRKLGLDPSRNGIRRVVSEAHALSPRKLVAYGIVAIGYGLLEGVEGWGLFRRRRWAEYLTVVATALLFVPEIWELVKRPTPLKIGGIVVNALVVAYLIHRLRRGR